MVSEVKNLVKHAAIYGTGIILSKLVSFIMLPIYTHFLTPSDFGVLELLVMTIDIIAILVGMGITATVFRYYSKYDNQTDKGTVVSTALIMMFVSSFMMGVICILSSSHFSMLVFQTYLYSYYFKLCFLILIVQAGIEIPLVFIRAKERSLLFVIISVAKLIIQVMLNIYFVVVLKMGILGILYSTLIGSTVLVTYLSVYTIWGVGVRFSISKSLEMLRFGYPLVLWSVGSFILTFSDRMFLNIYTDLHTVGIYALAYKFGFLLTIIAFTPFNMIWEPQRFEIAKRKDALLTFRKVFLYLNIFLIFISLVIAIFVKDVLVIMADAAFWKAHKVVPIILIAYILQTWTAFCNIGLFVKERTTLYALSSVIAVASVILANYLLIPRYGAYGAARAAVIAFSIRFICVYGFSQRLFPIEYGWDRILNLILVAVVAYLIRFIVDTEAPMFSIGINVGLLLLFMIITYHFVLDSVERGFVKRLFQRPLSVSTGLIQRKV